MPILCLRAYLLACLNLCKEAIVSFLVVIFENGRRDVAIDVVEIKGPRRKELEYIDGVFWACSLSGFVSV